MKKMPIANRFSYIALLLISLMIVASSCQAPKDLEFRESKNLKIESVGFSEALLKVDLVYYNPNNFGLELNRTDLDLFVDSTFLGHSTQNLQVAIGGRKEFTLPLAVSLDIKNLLKNGITALFNREVNVRLLGNVKVGKAGIYKNIKVDYTSKQNFSMFR